MTPTRTATPSRDPITAPAMVPPPRGGFGFGLGGATFLLLGERVGGTVDGWTALPTVVPLTLGRFGLVVCTGVLTAAGGAVDVGGAVVGAGRVRVVRVERGPAALVVHVRPGRVGRGGFVVVVTAYVEPTLIVDTSFPSAL